LPSSENASVLLTTRQALPPDEARAARELATDDLLGGHALALSLAGAYLKRVRSQGFAAYVDKLRQDGLTASLEKAAKHAGYAVLDHERSIIATYKLSYDLLDPEDDIDARATELLAFASLLAPGVTVDCALMCRFLGADAEATDLAIARLLDISLLSGKFRAATDFKVHALVSDYTRFGLSSRRAGSVCVAALRTLDSLFPDNATDFWKILTPRGAADWEPLTESRQQHVASLLAHGARLAEDPENAGWMRGLSISQDNFGNVLLAKGDVSAALVEIRASFEIARRLAQQDPENAGWMRDLAVSCWKIASCTEGSDAIERLEQGLAILHRLNEKGRLSKAQENSIPMFEAKLHDLTA
jgi:hypothetical protein